MSKIQIRPQLYRQLGDDAGAGVHFRLLVNTSIASHFAIDDDNRYLTRQVVTCDDPSEFEGLLHESSLPRPLHVLVITPECLFSSPSSDVLGETCKLLVMPCYSTANGVEDIRHFVEIMERTDVDAQERWAAQFFDAGEKSEYLDFIDEHTGTRARFNHISEEYEWFEQLGPLAWGGQQFSPAGEISVLRLFHANYDPSKQLDVSGEITLNGYPILNAGRASFLRGDQERIYRELATLRSAKLIATIERGVMTALTPQDEKAKPALDMLNTLFAVDSRYRVIWEIGFGSNTNMSLLDGNHAPNESYGHEFGCVHFGFGLTPWTQYHLDILCPHTRVVTSVGDHIAGGTVRRAMRRQTAVGCPCLVD
jgi:hypothetical protein